MRALFLVALLASALVVAAGCGGDSKEDQAKSDVCDARADIKTQVEKLSNTTLDNATLNGVKDSLTAIGDDLKKIRAARGDLSDELQKEVGAANNKFSSQVQDIAKNLGTNLSLNSAKDQLKAAFQQLKDAYEQTFAKFDCS
ncbi:MAG TPA: hypothetical protein VGF25_01335 [Thermoleophilaceae bacterium]|jgi:hypothetical protein